MATIASDMNHVMLQLTTKTLGNVLCTRKNAPNLYARPEIEKLLTFDVQKQIRCHRMPFLPVNMDEEDREAIKDQADFQRYKKNCMIACWVLSQDRQVIKKTDLNKAISDGGRSLYHTITRLVILSASHDLHKYFGVRLFDLGDSKGYLLVNAYSDYNSYRKTQTEEQYSELAVIFLTLMEIFSSADESCSEDQIREVLQHLDLSESDLKKHIEFMHKKLYIVPVRESITQQEEKLYKWGPRAIAEVDPDKFMESFLDLAEEGESKDWPEQQTRIRKLKELRGA